MAIEYNGIVFPDFPEGLFDDTYKYGMFFKNFVVNRHFYGVVTSPVEFAHLPAEMIDMPTDYVGTMTTCRYSYYLEDSGAWDSITEDECLLPLSEYLAILWSNHDIKTVIEINEDTFELITGDEVYFARNDTPAEPEPEYGKIRRQHMRDIGDAIRRKTGKKDKIPTPQLAGEIDSIVTADGMPVAEEAAFGTATSEKEYGYATWKAKRSWSGGKSVGYTFIANAPTCLIGFRFMQSKSPYTARLALWDVENNTELTFLNVGVANSSAWWQEGMLATPVILEVGKTYAVVCSAPTEAFGYYELESMTANGRITIIESLYGSTSEYPNTPMSEYYGLDMIIANVPDVVDVLEYKIQTQTLTELTDEVKRIAGLGGVLTLEQTITALKGM